MPLMLHPHSTCDTCLEPYANGVSPHAISCGHVFCQECLHRLTQCPLCRKGFGPRDIRKLYIECGPTTTSERLALPSESPVVADNESRRLLEDIAHTVSWDINGDEIQRLMDECKAYNESQPRNRFIGIRVSFLLLHNLLVAQRKLDVQAEVLRQVTASNAILPSAVAASSHPSSEELNMIDSHPLLQEVDGFPNEWDGLEATTADSEQTTNYQFQANNPYLLRSTSGTWHRDSYSQHAYKSVLELEAAVQRDQTNAVAWFELGVKQQESSRDAKAIQAFRHAVELDPAHFQSWLELAVSYVNEGDELNAYDAFREWILRNPMYGSTVSGSTLPTGTHGNFMGLIDVLLRFVSADDVDADLKIALGVLMYATGEDTNVLDCFRTALNVRPNDWSLYNYVGAALESDQQSTDAVAYYHQALALNPFYVRARSNLGISCMKLGLYYEAASHILNALTLQYNNGLPDELNRDDLHGETSTILWDHLKACFSHLEWPGSVEMCDYRDLAGLREVFNDA